MYFGFVDTSYYKTNIDTVQLNLKIELQLAMLAELRKRNQTWQWDSKLKTAYYDSMQEKEFVKGNANNKEKDARAKTSGLVDIGLLTANRELTPVGQKLLEMSQNHDFKENNFFELEADSYLYFKQLLKTHLEIDGNIVRPYIVLAKLLTTFKYLSDDEFTYFLPLCVSDLTTQTIIKQIPLFRGQQADIKDVIYETLIKLTNYQTAFNLLMNNPISEDLICVIGMNRKSRTYDKPYYQLFLHLNDVFINNDDSKIFDLYQSAKAIKQGAKWINFLFKNSNQKSIKKLGREHFCENNPFLLCQNETDLKATFFKYLHVFKAIATLDDYFDLNKRYFNLTNTVIFADAKVQFDILPKYFFENVIDNLYSVAYQKNDDLQQNIELNQIHSSLSIHETAIYKQISKDYNTKITSSSEVYNLLHQERYSRFTKLLNEKFGKENLLKLLDCFETRNDSEIYKLVTDEADIPSSFEYVLAIIWYEISERQGDILQFMNLSLQADLLPKSHATGGYADIIYQYEKTKDYPKHDVLIEATLATGVNQRRMELEPVSRHLGDYLLKYQNEFDYSIFASTFLHLNVVSDFLHRKSYWYYAKDNITHIEGMKIIPINTQWLKNALEQDKKYRDLYPFFEKLHNQDIKPHEWQDSISAFK